MSCQSIRLLGLDMDRQKGNGSIAKPTIHSGRQTKRGHKTILVRFLNDPFYRDSQIKIGWSENKCIAYDEIVKEGPFLRCDKMRKKQKRKFVEARVEL